jgi:DNA-directed RNA polymerase subunit RPC12/RpoP
MSEFKYACPVCGQHIKCDSSQAGTQMECPTCFQKITVPQAPATDDQKLIITGTKVGERPAPTIQEDRAVAVEKNSPVTVAVVTALLVLACAAGAVVFAFRDKIFKSSVASAPTSQAAPGSGEEQPPARPQPRPRPAPLAPLVAPHANDTNWMLNLEAAVIPTNSTAAGRIHGQDFICERAYVESGALVLRAGMRGPAPFALTINFGVAQPESLAGQSINVTTNVPKAAIVTLRWTGDDGKTIKGNYTNGYALRLDFNKLAGNHVSGRIYFCAPDDLKSYVMGTFNANIRRPRPQPQ